MPANTPTATAMSAVPTTMGHCAANDMSASTMDETNPVKAQYITPTAMSHATKHITTASTNSPARRLRSELPNTLRVLMLFMRMGVRAVLKLVKLMAAMSSIITAMAINTYMVPLLALGMLSKRNPSSK